MEAGHQRGEAVIETFSLSPSFTHAELDAMLTSAYRQGVSDITIQSGDQVWVELHGRIRPLTQRFLHDSEVKMAITYMYGNNAIGVLSGGHAIDKRYEINVDRKTKIGFRLNATPSRVGDILDGVSITMRTLPSLPPKIEELDLPAPILESIFPMNGAVFIVGRTGDGKSTTLASVIRKMLEDGEDRKIISYELPIEFTYTGLKTKCPMPSQVEIGPHLASFTDGMRNAMRRKPSVILLTEARDADTMDALIEASLTGHATYSTIHAESVAETIMRIIHLFPYEAQSAAASKILGCLRLVIAQKLVKSLDGRRVALREWLAFDAGVKERLEAERFERWPGIVRKEVMDRGQGMEHAARAAFDAGRIDERTYLDAAGLKGGFIS
ncbi:MAG: Dot/Icm secretion system ATPase DotB [Chloroflexota bacterium]|jgi:defect-in-organelle-trafficking protein DotB|nr:MAG: Dot/Icm secretion system ATPase DotB [Chloroflexota bacterium]